MSCDSVFSMPLTCPFSLIKEKKRSRKKEKKEKKGKKEVKKL